MSLNNIVCADYVPDMTDSRHKEHVGEQQAEHAGNMERIRGWLQNDGSTAPDCDECGDNSDVEDRDDTWFCSHCERSWDNVIYSDGLPSEWGLELSPVWTIKSETGFILAWYDTQDFLEYCQKHGLDHDDGEIMVRFVISTGGPHDEYLLEISDNGWAYDGATHKYLPWFAGYCGDVPHDDLAELLDFFNSHFPVEFNTEKVAEMKQEFSELQWDYMFLDEEEEEYC